MRLSSASLFPSTPDGVRIYAVGDVHGRMDLLTRLLDRIAADAAQHAGRSLQMVFLGDYIDRGPQSRQVVERLLAGAPSSGPLAGAEWVCLRGNHEDYLVRFITDVSSGRAWCANGGVETVQSYAGPQPETHSGDLAALQLALSRSLPRSHLRFLTRLPLWHRAGDYLFVHAGIRPGLSLDQQDPADMMWIRDDFLFDPTPHPWVVVHGHSQRPLPEVRANRIGVDTGAYRSGVLSAVVLDGTEQHFLST
jgi:serine/threonine protein phosphatase 1